MYNILNFTLEELQGWMKENKESAFRAKQVFSWIYKDVWNFDDMKNIPGALKEKLKENFIIDIPKIVEVYESNVDDTKKLLLSMQDNNLIECVLMKYKHGNSICVSTQVGCRMGCKFCASTIGGRIRDLSSGEILAQIMVAQRYLGERISNVVLMGSGEPLDNFDNVIKFLKLVNAEYGLNIGQRHITLSTCGIVPKIIELADLNLSITLAISLHAFSDEKRRVIMPIANKYSIEEIMEACRYYLKQTNRRISFEYSLVKDVNDTEECAQQLISLVKGMNCHINLIPVNPIKERDYRQSEQKAIYAFKNKLEKNGINVTIRREMGSDIDGACGQLRRKTMQGV